MPAPPTPLEGLSPRVRGNLAQVRRPASEVGSIPACAGEPPCGRRQASHGRVYPRVCGGTRVPGQHPAAFVGLSPRVRGNPRPATRTSVSSGSIPACAGEPPGGPASRFPPRVYPRVCGGTGAAGKHVFAEAGLSPRVRGNQPVQAKWRAERGSIPACAGEPPRLPRLPHRARVYPRVCGGTPASSPSSFVTRGLSPRVRGNPLPQPDCGRAGGSIPACAGEPSAPPRSAARGRVYPRVCGGTRRSRAACKGTWGLSPRVRGTSPPQSVPSRPAGLSPRVRGNHAQAFGGLENGGSIPACAGEP